MDLHKGLEKEKLGKGPNLTAAIGELDQTGDQQKWSQPSDSSADRASLND